MLHLIPLLALAAVIASPAKSAPDPATQSSEMPISDADFARELRTIIATREPAVGLPRLETLSRRQGLSNRQKAVVANMRVSALVALTKIVEARNVAEQLVRELPQSAEAHLILAHVTSAANDYSATADAISQASQLDPAIVNQIKVYDLSIVFSWLKSEDKLDRATALAQRLFDAGWDNGGPKFRSRLALDVVEEHLAKGDNISAGRYVPMIADPNVFAKILSEKRFAAVRSAAQDWAGARLEKQWPVYLQRTRATWLKSGSAESAADYASALSLAGHHKTLVDTFLPVFDRALDPNEDHLWIFLVSPLANALATLGRWDEAFALLDRASKTWPSSWGANAINIDANRAKYRLLKGDFTVALQLFDAVLGQIKTFESEVTPQTSATISAYRLCAVHRSGKAGVTAEARQLADQWTMREPHTVSFLQLCLGQREDALNTWRTSLANPQTRTDVVQFIQPRSDKGPDSIFAREIKTGEDWVAGNPTLRAAVLLFGDRLNWSLQETAPKESEAQSR